MRALDREIGEGTRARLGIGVEIAQQSVGVRETRASQRGCKAAAGAKIKSAGPLPARRFAV